MQLPNELVLENPVRLAALRATGLLDSAPEEPFDLFTRLARKILGVPIALVSLVDVDRQFFKSCLGLPEPLATSRQTPLEMSFCKHAVQTGEPFIVEDARKHTLVKDNPVIAQGVIAYAGIPLTTQDGQTLGSFCVIDHNPRQWTDDEIDILKDLAAAVMLEIEYRRDLHSVRNAVHAKNHFLAVLSHELRTPLAPALMTATSLAEDPEMPEKWRDDIRLIQRNIELETRLVDDLLDSTRIATGKLRLDLETTDMHELLKQCVAMCAADAARKDVTICLNLEATAHDVRGDGPKLHQVFCNILKNAIKFTPSRGHVAIQSTNQGAGRIQMQISDTGVGVAAEHLPKMFNAFEQGDTRTTQRFGGLGLGLAICKGIVDAHGGSITASSAGRGRGTTVAVGLATFPSTKKSILKAPAAEPRKRQVRILLVEDHPDTLKALKRILTSFHYQVLTADSVESAVQAAAENDFDILISDVGLSDGSGIDLMRRLSTKGPVRGIALTGYGMEGDLERTRAAGFSRHLLKPVNFVALDQAIRELAGDLPPTEE